jgi:hypothetical protein
MAEAVGDDEPEVGGDTVLEDVHATSANAASTAAIPRDRRTNPPSDPTVHPALRFPQADPLNRRFDSSEGTSQESEERNAGGSCQIGPPGPRMPPNDIRAAGVPRRPRWKE